MERSLPGHFLEIQRLDQLISQLLVKHEGRLKIMIKNEKTKEQVKDFLSINGYTYDLSQVQYDAFFDIELQSNASLGETMVQKKPVIFDQVLVISSDQLGTGDTLYGQGLLQSTLMSWFERDPLPAKIIFMNSGVTLLGSKSHLMDAFRRLKGQGVELYASTTCMAHYGIPKPFDCVELKTTFQLVQLMKTTKNTITL
jgi:hypothetical protein